MKQRFLAVVTALFLVCSAGAQNLAEDVIKNGDLKNVLFVNYVGPHKVVESRAAIQGIGQELGRQMKAKPGENGTAQKYRVVRVHDPKADQLSADVFILGPEASVDHIRNLNWIIAGYLQQAFGYSFDDALLLADFVSRYNAVNRGKLDYFQKLYIPALAQQLTAETAGLSTNYAQWPGKTRIVIPLRDSLTKGPGGQVNAEEISNKSVTDKMKGEPQALDNRKKITDLKETEIVQEKKTIAAKEQEIAKKEDKLKQPDPAATPAPAAAPTNKNTTPATPATPATPVAAPATTPAATPAAAPAATDPQAEKKKLEDDKAAVAKAKAANDARDQQLQQDRKDIVQQEKKQESAPAAPPVKAPPATNAFVVVSKTGMGQLVLVDIAGKSIYKRSELNTIRKSQFQEFAAGYLAIAGENKGDGAIRLVLLKKDDLSLQTTGTDDVSLDGPLLVSGPLVYVVIKDSRGNYVLAAVDAKLQVAVKSDDAVAFNTALSLAGSALLVQSAMGKPLVLDAKTLKKIAETEN